MNNYWIKFETINRCFNSIQVSLSKLILFLELVTRSLIRNNTGLWNFFTIFSSKLLCQHRDIFSEIKIQYIQKSWKRKELTAFNFFSNCFLKSIAELLFFELFQNTKVIIFKDPVCFQLSFRKWWYSLAWNNGLIFSSLAR